MGVPSIYTIYAVDSSGNDALYQVECTADAVKSIKLNYVKKTIKKGKTYKLKTTLSKSGTYGRKVTYTSSKKVCRFGVRHWQGHCQEKGHGYDYGQDWQWIDC